MPNMTVRRLFIAEKPSLGRAIAVALGNQQKDPSGIRCGDDFVTWASGHILRLASPDEIRDEWVKWSLDQLPILPETWKKLPSKQEFAAQRLAIIKKLLPNADEVVNAGDADREGQLLIDEILEYFKYRRAVKRLLITDTTPAAIRRAIAEMKNNSAYVPLRDSAMARERTDWLIGMNMSRLYSIRTDQRLSLGRVQTPTLGLIVNRDKEIAAFKPVPYWQIQSTLSCEGADKATFKALWQPGDDQEGLDSEGRLINEPVANALIKRLAGCAATVMSVKSERKSTKPPLPHSLPTLQIACSNKHNLSAADTLAILQELYEQGLTTYPRSDCAYLPSSRVEEAPGVLAGIAAALPALKPAIDKADISIRTVAWNDKKVTEHFAIIPTGETPSSLSDAQAKVYREVASQYIAQFMGDYIYVALEVLADIGGEGFKATGRRVVSLGWKSVTGSDDEDDKITILPEVLKRGDALEVFKLDKLSKETQPPKHFTEASLLQAMNGIHKFVTDPEIRKTLKEVDGIGTAATQASIIEKIIKRGYVEKSKKNLLATKLGKDLIASVSDELSRPDFTAVMEQQVKRVYTREMSLDAYMTFIRDLVARLVGDAKDAQVSIAPGSHGGSGDKSCPCPACKSGTMVRKKSKYGLFWACQNPDCKLILDDVKGKPAKVETCPKCGGVMKRFKRKDGSGYFWHCSNKACGLFMDDIGGKPVKQGGRKMR